MSWTDYEITEDHLTTTLFLLLPRSLRLVAVGELVEFAVTFLVCPILATFLPTTGRSLIVVIFQPRINPPQLVNSTITSDQVRYYNDNL